MTNTAPTFIIIRDSAGNLFRVSPKLQNPEIPQAYVAYPVKKTRDGYKVKTPGIARLVRKFGTSIVAVEG